MNFKSKKQEPIVQFRVRGAYIGAWAKKVGTQASAEIVAKMSTILQEEVRRAVREEARPRVRGSGTPLTIPNSSEFFDSFKTRIVGKKTVEVVCSYPFIRSLLEGRAPYPMPWLNRNSGVPVVPIEQRDGTVVLRATPAAGEKPWVHPGFESHKFLQVAMQRARDRITEFSENALADAALSHLQELVKK